MPKAIHQFIAGFQPHDAITNEALHLQRIVRGWGFESDLFTEQQRVLPEYRKQVKDIYSYAKDAQADDVVLLHLSTGSRVNDAFATLPCRKAILYHNITPWEFMAGIHEQQARLLRRGLEQTERLAGKAELVMAHSRFSAAELEARGYENVQVLPLLLDFKALKDTPHAKTLAKYRDGMTNILFVGREVPNKRIIDIAHAFYYFQKFVEPNSRLIYVGSSIGMESYHAMLLARFGELVLDEVVLTGPVTHEELNAYYQVADLFLCMSEHEGFCVPLLESMHFDVPILAYSATAVPETLDGSGVLFHEKRFDLVAEMMNRITKDAALKEKILEGQRAALQRYLARDLEKELRGYLEGLLGV